MSEKNGKAKRKGRTSTFEYRVGLRREIRRRKIAKLLLRGVTNQAEIANRVGCTKPTVSTDIRAIREEWRREMTAFFDSAKEEAIKKLDLIEQNAWRAWEESRKDRQKIIRRTNADGELELVDSKEGQTGDPRYLELVRKCVEDKRKLLGLDRPEQIDIKLELTRAATQVQEAMKNNEEYLAYKRNLLLGRDLIAGPTRNGDQQREMESVATSDASRYPAGKGSDATPSSSGTKVARPRNRFD